MGFKLYYPSRLQMATMGIIGLITLLFCSLLSAMIMGGVYEYSSTRQMLMQIANATIPFLIMLLLLRYHEIYVKGVQ